VVYRIRVILGCFFWLLTGLFHPSGGFPGHPLITDDTGTQGKGGLQVEVNGMLGHDRDGVVTQKAREAGTMLSYGLFDNADVVLGIPYQHISTKDRGGSQRHRGISDLSLELKWRFYEGNGLSLAFKPGMTLPTGNDKKGLGTGRPTYGPTFIVTKEVAPWAFHFNLGYRRNENRLLERMDLWHTSLASEFEVLEGIRLVSNVGMERNTDKTSNTHPAFIIGGVIYSPTKSLDLNLGVQFGLSKTETDYTIHPGIVFTFNFE